MSRDIEESKCSMAFPLNPLRKRLRGADRQRAPMIEQAWGFVSIFTVEQTVKER
jgi:hypothetical protein